jgi:general secretion pathway protein A
VLVAAERPSAPVPAGETKNDAPAAGEVGSIMDPDSGAVLADTPGKEQSYRQLAALWGVQLNEEQRACDEAPKAGLHCFSRDGGFAALRLVDRPAVIELRDKDGKSRHLLLVALHDASATLRSGNQTQTVELGLLARGFTGGFLTYWRAPAEQREMLRPGDRGADVDRIATQIARINRETAPPAGKPYDDKLQQQVRAFQAMQGLPADGIVGPVTLMRLNRAAGVNEPWLLDRKSAGGTPSSPIKE